MLLDYYDECRKALIEFNLMIKLRTEAEIVQNWKGDINTPVVSISCITYNHGMYIRDAIEGFLIQETDFPFKIFILDDASTDNNVEIIKEYESKYPKLFKCFYLRENTWQKPDRLVKAKPFLDERNKGKYIAMCEGDDYWTNPLKLQKQVNFLEANPEYGLVFTDYDEYHEDSKTLKPNIHSKKEKFLKSFEGDFYEPLLIDSFIGTLTTMFKYSLLTEEDQCIIQKSTWRMGDRLLWMLLSRRSKIHFLNESTAVYRRHFGSASYQTDDDTEFFKSSYDMRFYFIEKYGCSLSTRNKVEIDYYQGLIFRYYQRKSFKNAKFALRNLKRLQLVRNIDYLYLLGSINSTFFFITRLLLGLKKRFIKLRTNE